MTYDEDGNIIPDKNEHNAGPKLNRVFTDIAATSQQTNLKEDEEGVAPKPNSGSDDATTEKNETKTDNDGMKDAPWYKSCVENIQYYQKQHSK